MSVRLNKFIADCSGISRRKADTLIEEQAVRVNGKPATLGQTINPDEDKVTLRGQLLVPERKRYIVFHKPKNCITTRHDPEGRKTIYDWLPEALKTLDPVGRLDRDSTGLLLMSNDGTFVQRLSHPRYAHNKVYRVKLNQNVTESILHQLEAGIVLEPEGKLAVAHVQEVVDLKTVILVLKTGMNRQIRRSFEALGYSVLGLKRTAFAGITLGKLKPGEYRELKPGELKQLMPTASRKPLSRKPKKRS